MTLFEDLQIQHHQRTLAGPMQLWVQQNRLPPVLLFTGQDGIGKAQVVRFLSQWIFCEAGPWYQPPQEGLGFGLDLEITSKSSTPAFSPCQACSSCERFRAKNETRFTEITSQEGTSEDSGTLKIELFRKLKESIGLSLDPGQFKIVFIPKADRMTPQAANSVLKCLEEPPPGWIFFLTAQDPSLLLPTLVSRCQKIRLSPLPPAVIAAILAQDGVSEDKIPTIARLSQGSLKHAKLLARPEIWEHRQRVFQFFKAPHQHLNEVADWATQDVEHFEMTLDFMEQALSEWIRASLDPSNIPVATEIQPTFQQTIKRLGVESARLLWISQSEHLAETREKIPLPLNRKLLIQNALFPWLEVNP